MSLKYNSKYPLARLEKGDRAIIKVNNIYNSIEDIPARERKYLDVPNGIYEAIYKGDYELECKKQPLLSGTYCHIDGNKWRTSYGIFADEKIIKFDKFPLDVYEIEKESKEKHTISSENLDYICEIFNRNVFFENVNTKKIDELKVGDCLVDFIRGYNFNIIPLYEILEGGK